MSQIPEQDALLSFEISPIGQLKLAQTLTEDTDFAAASIFKDELIGDDAPLSYLKEKYKGSNEPHAEYFSQTVADLYNEIVKNVEEINFVKVFAYSRRFEAKRRAAHTHSEEGESEWPTPSVPEVAAIELVSEMLPPFLSTSGVARKLMADAHEIRATEIEQRRLADAMQGVVSDLIDSQMLAPEEKSSIEAITEIDPNEPNRRRTTRLRYALGASLLVSTVGALAAISPATGAVALGAVAAGGTWLTSKAGWEVVKGTRTFSEWQKRMSQRVDHEVASDEKFRMFFERIERFWEASESRVFRLSKTSPDYSWANTYMTKRNSSLSKIKYVEDSVTAPMIGTVYLAPEPGARTFIKVGDRVEKGQTLVIIEAMKTMNLIPSPFSGIIEAVLVDDGDPVEFGAPLVIVA